MNLPLAYIDPAKMEILAREYVMTGQALLAAMRSGIKLGELPMFEVANELMKRPDVKAAIREMRKQLKGVAPDVAITKLSIAQDLQEVFDSAYAAEDWRSCISAKSEQAKILGFMIQKVEVSTPTDPDQMTTAQLEAYLKQMTIEGDSERVIDVEPGDGDEESSIPSPS